MHLIGETIDHMQFGKGVVTACQHNIISVDFAGRVRHFVYPDAFEQYLVPKDTDTKEEINDLLVEQKLEEKRRLQEDLEHQRKMAHLRAMKIPAIGQVVFDLDNQEDNDPFTTGQCLSGVYLSGYSKGEPRVPQRMMFNSMCLLTRRPQGQSESQRVIEGMAMTQENFVGDHCTDGVIPFHPDYQVKLSRPVPFWHYLDKEPQKSWGRTTFRYITNKAGEEILWDIRRQMAGSGEEEALNRFYRYYCACNRLTGR